MKLKFVCLLWGFLISLDSQSQKNLSKSEIFSYWVHERNGQDVDDLESIIDLPFSDDIQKQLVTKVNQLKAKYDTVGFYLISRIGMISIDSCEKGNYPTAIYIFWKNSGKTFLQKLTNHCSYTEKEIINSSFFNYYKQNVAQIQSESIMPVILSATKQDDKVQYKMITTSHDIVYVISCKMGQNKKLLRFSEDALTNRQSLFYIDNIKSKSYSWFLQIKDAVLVF